RKKDAATQRCARRSAYSLSEREPVKRQITIALARPSTAEEAAHVRTEIEFACRPATKPITLSRVIHARLTHDSNRARRASVCHSAGRGREVTSGSSKLTPAPSPWPARP